MKCSDVVYVPPSRSINSNMRCIEIYDGIAGKVREELINSNMRCIEILVHLLSPFLRYMINSNMRCIEITGR